MNRSDLETLSFSEADAEACSPDGAKPLTVAPAHYATIPLFCPTDQLLFGIAEIKKLERFLLCMGLFSALCFGRHNRRSKTIGPPRGGPIFGVTL
ncbi:hypothetical protein [Bradyrhizobium sp. LB11.1]|uniref:hypothetical protein n=1 Tax=Bradyrhizobium sp. LB11.1 TaxID=3156326 RepID=UPI0033910A23